ncbi:unnamed protein product [Pleuronectes platessa]|uniref:Uncharacterized protein n=1 Tax=Pleuronectes platessa TaxID=8262 RepID=A0A9N7V6G2_PLEPL|nr:unnamed protein product [Pleuronectes platessa]
MTGTKRRVALNPPHPFLSNHSSSRLLLFLMPPVNGHTAAVLCRHINPRGGQTSELVFFTLLNFGNPGRKLGFIPQIRGRFRRLVCEDCEMVIGTRRGVILRWTYSADSGGGSRARALRAHRRRSARFPGSNLVSRLLALDTTPKIPRHNLRGWS